MGDIIPFPESKKHGTEKELHELQLLKEQIANATTLREIIRCKKLLKEFKGRLDAGN